MDVAHLVNEWISWAGRLLILALRERDLRLELIEQLQRHANAG
jgi:hypothetical protein